MIQKLIFLYISFVSWFFIENVFGSDSDHIYKEGDQVTLWVNKIGPYHNPQETYEYYDLPFCKPTMGVETTKKSHSLGEQLEGHLLRVCRYYI